MSTNQIPSLVNGSVQPSYTNYFPQRNDFAYYTSSQPVNSSYYKNTSSSFPTAAHDYKNTAYKNYGNYPSVPYHHGYVNRPSDIRNENSNYGNETLRCSVSKRRRSRSTEKNNIDLFDLAVSNPSAGNKSSDSSMEEEAEKEKINLKRQKLSQIRQKWRKRNLGQGQGKGSETKKGSENLGVSNSSKQGDSVIASNSSKQSDSINASNSSKLGDSTTASNPSKLGDSINACNSSKGNTINASTSNKLGDSVIASNPGKQGDSTTTSNSETKQTESTKNEKLNPSEKPTKNDASRRIQERNRDGNDSKTGSRDGNLATEPRFKDSSPPIPLRRLAVVYKYGSGDYSSTRRYRDTSPPSRRFHDFRDSSPTSSRRFRHDRSEISPYRNRYLDFSPPRHARYDSTDSSPSRHHKHDSSSSPTRRPRHDTSHSPTRRHDTSHSPTRRFRYDSSNSPTRRHDTSHSPTRRHRHDTSHSPTRRHDTSHSPTRRFRYDSSNSPSRRHDTSNSPTRRFRYDTSNSPTRRHDSSNSPTRRHDTSNSPTRRFRYDTSNSPTRRHDSSNSPTRRHDTSNSPTRRPRHDTSNSPTRRPRHDTSNSPTRRSRHDTSRSPTHRFRHDPSKSPTRRHARHDTSSSPVRYDRRDASRSPVRRHHRHDTSRSLDTSRSPTYARHDTSSSPVSRTRHDTSISPVRRHHRHGASVSPVRHRHGASSSPVRHRHDTSSSPTRHSTSSSQTSKHSSLSHKAENGSKDASPAKRTRHDTPTPTRDEPDENKYTLCGEEGEKEGERSVGGFTWQRDSSRRQTSRCMLGRKRRHSRGGGSRETRDPEHRNKESTVEEGELKSSEESSFSDTNCVGSAKHSLKDGGRETSLTPYKGQGHHVTSQGQVVSFSESPNHKHFLDESVSPCSLVIVSESETNLTASPNISPVKTSSLPVKKLFGNEQDYSCEPMDRKSDSPMKSPNRENPQINGRVSTPKSDSTDLLKVFELEKQNLEFQKKIIELKLELEAKNGALETLEMDADSKIVNLNETYSEEVEVLKEEITFLKRDNDRERAFTAKSKTKEKDLLNKIGRLEDGLLHSGKENLELRERLKKLEEEIDSLRYKKYPVNYSTTSTAHTYFDFTSK